MIKVVDIFPMAWAWKIGFIVIGAATILLALYWIGLNVRMRQEKKSKKKRSIYERG